MAETPEGMKRILLVPAGKTDVAVRVQVAPGRLSPTKASLVRLIVAEAASNSVKHAFSGRFGSQMEVSRSPAGPGQLRLIIEGDGSGFGAGEAGARQSLGTTIMAGFAQQPGGELWFGEGHQGAAPVQLTFTTDADNV